MHCEKSAWARVLAHATALSGLKTQVRYKAKFIKRQEAFTLVELLIVTSIIAMLLSIVLPVLSRVRSLAKTAMCQTNERQIGLALNNYAASHNGLLVPQACYPWISQMEARQWGEGINWQHCLINPYNPRESVTARRGDQGLAKIRCPNWPKGLASFGAALLGTGGYAINDNLDGICSWQIIPGANPELLRQSYIPPNINNVRSPSSKYFIVESLAYDGDDDNAAEYCKDTVDSWGFIESTTLGKGKSSLSYRGWLRFDHGRNPSGALATKNKKSLGRDKLLKQKTNVLYMDSHSQIITLKNISEAPSSWRPYRNN